MLSGIFSIYILVEAIWLILPAYAANGLAPLARGKRRLDLGRNCPDGRPLLGQGKTVEGLLFGSMMGVLIGLVEMLAYPYLPWGLSDVPLNIAPMTPLLGFLLGFGALSGDIVGAFIKRRLGMRRGAPFPILDQDDFVAGALVFASLLIAVQFSWAVLLLVMTPLVHFAACVIGYLLKVKKEPW